MLIAFHKILKIVPFVLILRFFYFNCSTFRWRTSASGKRKAFQLIYEIFRFFFSGYVLPIKIVKMYMLTILTRYVTWAFFLASCVKVHKKRTQLGQIGRKTRYFPSLSKVKYFSFFDKEVLHMRLASQKEKSTVRSLWICSLKPPALLKSV